MSEERLRSVGSCSRNPITLVGLEAPNTSDSKAMLKVLEERSMECNKGRAMPIENSAGVSREVKPHKSSTLTAIAKHVAGSLYRNAAAAPVGAQHRRCCGT